MCSNGLPTPQTVPEADNVGVVPVKSQVNADLTLNERMLKMETKSKKQENQISILTATLVEDKTEITIL